MNLIVFKYKHFLIPRTITRNIPAKFDEMNAHQFHAVADLLQNELSEPEFLCRFLKVSPDVLLRLDKFLLYKITEMLSYIADLRKPMSQFIIRKIPMKRFFAPENKLRNVSLLQFMYADNLFTNYSIDQCPEQLRALVAAMYLPEGINFENVDMEKHIRNISSHVDETFCQAVFLNFIFIKKWLSVSFSDMFSYSGSTEENTGPKRAKWLDMFDSFVGDDIPSTEYYKKMKCIDAFRIINKRIKEYKKYAK